MIPRIVHVCWVGPKPFPYADNLATWSRHNPGWDVRLWTDGNLPELANRDVYDLMPAYSIKVDILRLELLARFGGLYSDADSWCELPLDALVRGRRALGMTGQHGNVGPGTLACMPRHRAFVRLVDGVRPRYEQLRKRCRDTGRGVSIHSVYATRYITPVLRADPTFHQVDRGRKAGTRRLICSVNDAGPDSYIVHNSANSWRAELGGRKVRL